MTKDSEFVFVEKPKQSIPGKTTVAGNVVVTAKSELSDIANQNDVSLSEVVTQMIYFCLGRDQLTGNKIKESSEE